MRLAAGLNRRGSLQMRKFKSHCETVHPVYAYIRLKKLAFGLCYLKK